MILFLNNFLKQQFETDGNHQNVIDLFRILFLIKLGKNFKKTQNSSLKIFSTIFLSWKFRENKVILCTITKMIVIYVMIYSFMFGKVKENNFILKIMNFLNSKIFSFS